MERQLAARRSLVNVHSPPLIEKVESPKQKFDNLSVVSFGTTDYQSFSNSAPQTVNEYAREIAMSHVNTNKNVPVGSLLQTKFDKKPQLASVKALTKNGMRSL